MAAKTGNSYTTGTTTDSVEIATASQVSQGRKIGGAKVGFMQFVE